MRAKFDVICKDLILDLGASLNFVSESSYPIDPQIEVESSTGFRGRQRSSYFTVDAVWLQSIAETQARGSWTSTFMSDVIVAWEVDAISGHKAIRTSIDNLATLNPRLGIELLLIGANKGAIEGFESRFDTAVIAARMKASRIIVIHDVIFCNLYWYVTGQHPILLYEEYLRVAREKSELSAILTKRWADLIERTDIDGNFRKELNKQFLKKLTE